MSLQDDATRVPREPKTGFHWVKGHEAISSLGRRFWVEGHWERDESMSRRFEMDDWQRQEAGIILGRKLQGPPKRPIWGEG
jgi:hypothetical protein